MRLREIIKKLEEFRDKLDKYDPDVFVMVSTFRDDQVDILQSITLDEDGDILLFNKVPEFPEEKEQEEPERWDGLS